MWTEFSREGGTVQRGTLVDGARDGAWIEWHRNGTKRFECQYSEGRVVGGWSSWYEDGRPATGAGEVFFRDPTMAFMRLGSAEPSPVSYLVDLDADGIHERLHLEGGDPDRLPPDAGPPSGEAHERVVRVDGDGTETLVLDTVIGSWDHMVFSWAHGVSGFVDVAGDGELEIVYYQGDDTWDQTSYVFRRGGRYQACTVSEEVGSLGFAEDPLRIVDSMGEGERIVAHWDSERGVLVGDHLFRVTADSVNLRRGPGLGSEVITRLSRGDLVLALVGEEPASRGGPEAAAATDSEYVHVSSDGRRGYIHREFLGPWSCPAESGRGG